MIQKINSTLGYCKTTICIDLNLCIFILTCSGNKIGKINLFPSSNISLLSSCSGIIYRYTLTSITRRVFQWEKWDIKPSHFLLNTFRNFIYMCVRKKMTAILYKYEFHRGRYWIEIILKYNLNVKNITEPPDIILNMCVGYFLM